MWDIMFFGGFFFVVGDTSHHEGRIHGIRVSFSFIFLYIVIKENTHASPGLALPTLRQPKSGIHTHTSRLLLLLHAHTRMRNEPYALRLRLWQGYIHRHARTNNRYEYKRNRRAAFLLFFSFLFFPILSRFLCPRMWMWAASSSRSLFYRPPPTFSNITFFCFVFIFLPLFLPSRFCWVSLGLGLR